MRVSYLGNFVPPHSTENHVAASLEALGHSVTRVQEGRIRARDVPIYAYDHDLFLWTQTYGLAEESGSLIERRRMLDDIKGLGVATAGFHLDRWWGLGREDQVRREPFFRVDHLFTADGGHDDRWAELGINHHWSPPAVYHAEAVDVPVSAKRWDVIFVGAWREYGHAEWWSYRRELLERLRARYGDRFTCWPQGPAIRGLKLNRLYAEARVVVGDSCLSGGITRFWSDRVPETLGRGGFIVHPYVEGIEQVEHLVTWPLGDWDAMIRTIDEYLEDDELRESARRRAAAGVRERHVYLNRVSRVLEEIA